MSDRIPWTPEGLQRWAYLIHRDLNIPFGDVDRLRDVVRYLPRSASSSGLDEQSARPMTRRPVVSAEALDATMKERDEARKQLAEERARTIAFIRANAPQHNVSEKTASYFAEAIRRGLHLEVRAVVTWCGKHPAEDGPCVDCEVTK